MSIKKLNIDNAKIFNDAINLSLEKLYNLIQCKDPNIFCLDNFVSDKELNKAGYQVYRTLLYDQIFEEQRQRAVEHNKEVQDKIDALKEEVKQLGSDMAPKDYPEPYKTRWDKLQDWKKWEGSYPFNEENVKEFAEFCEQSGGFEIY